MTLVHMDVYSSLVTSIKGYNHVLIISSSCSEHYWHYGIQTKVEGLAIAMRWMAETADFQRDHPILVVVTSKKTNLRS